MSTSVKANRPVGRVAKSDERRDEAGDDSKQIAQSAAPRQGIERKLLSIEIIDLLFPHLRLKEFRTQPNEPITNRQLRFLTQLNIESSHFHKRLATKFLNHVRARRELGLASISQLRVLMGLDIPDPDYVTFDEAQRLIRERFVQSGFSKMKSAQVDCERLIWADTGFGSCPRTSMPGPKPAAQFLRNERHAEVEETRGPRRNSNRPRRPVKGEAGQLELALRPDIKSQIMDVRPLPNRCFSVRCFSLVTVDLRLGGHMNTTRTCGPDAR